MSTGVGSVHEDEQSKLVDKCITDDLKILNSCSSFDHIMTAAGIEESHEIYHRAQHLSELQHTLKGEIQD